jgi:NO-binding membrane sensor protein with MHYT domain
VSLPDFGSYMLSGKWSWTLEWIAGAVLIAAVLGAAAMWIDLYVRVRKRNKLKRELNAPRP